MQRNINEFYISGFDYLRLMAVFGVIWIHGSDTNKLATQLQTVASFVVPCFVLMSAYLFQTSLFKQIKINYRDVITHKLIRLIPSYIAWSLIYILFRVAKHYLITHQPMNSDWLDWLASLVCGGASYQLWFVPALVIWIFIFLFVAKWNKQYENKPIVGSVLILVGIILLLCAHTLSETISIPPDYRLFVYSTINYFGYFPIGMGLAYIIDKNQLLLLAEKFEYSLIIVFICAMFLWSFMSIVMPAIWFSSLIYSLALFTLFLMCNKHSPKVWVKISASYAFGIYLCHALFVEGLQMVFPKIGINLGNFYNTFLLIIIVFILSAILCVQLGRFKSTRWLVI